MTFFDIVISIYQKLNVLPSKPEYLWINILQDVELEQPIFGANYIKGKVRAQPNQSNFVGTNWFLNSEFVPRPRPRPLYVIAPLRGGGEGGKDPKLTKKRGNNDENDRK